MAFANKSGDKFAHYRDIKRTNPSQARQMKQADKSLGTQWCQVPGTGHTALICEDNGCCICDTFGKPISTLSNVPPPTPGMTCPPVVQSQGMDRPVFFKPKSLEQLGLSFPPGVSDQPIPFYRFGRPFTMKSQTSVLLEATQGVQFRLFNRDNVTDISNWFDDITAEDAARAAMSPLFDFLADVVEGFQTFTTGAFQTMVANIRSGVESLPNAAEWPRDGGTAFGDGDPARYMQFLSTAAQVRATEAIRLIQAHNMPPKAVRVRVEAEAAYITFRSTDAFALPEALAETEIRIAMPSAAFPVDASGIVSRLRQAPGIDRRRVESHPILALISTVSAAATATAMPGTMTGIVGATAALLGLSAPAAGAVAFGVMAFLGLMSVQSDPGATSAKPRAWRSGSGSSSRA